MPYIPIVAATATVVPPSGSAAPLVDVGETLGTLSDELQAMLAGRTDVGPERLALWINFGYIDLAASLELDELKGSMSFPLVAGQPFYKTSPEVMATRGAAIVDTVTYGDVGGRPLEKTDLPTYRRNRNLLEEPREYFRERNIIVVWPTPVAVRTMGLDFWIRPDKMVGETDSPILGWEWHEAILLNARKKAFSALLEFDKAMAAENDFVNLVRRKSDRAEQEDSGKTVLSSVPRTRNQVLRRNARNRDDDDGLR
jgi:hypothetical protein